MTEVLHLSQDASCGVEVEGVTSLESSSDVNGFVEFDDGINETRSDTDESQVSSNVALFLFLKLQSKFVLPASTTQNLAEEMQAIQNVDNAIMFKQLLNKLLSMNMPDNKKCDIIDDLSAVI